MVMGNKILSCFDCKKVKYGYKMDNDFYYCDCKKPLWKKIKYLYWTIRFRIGV